MQHAYSRNHFYTLTAKYCSEHAVVETLWTELEQHYSAPGRYYHTLNHISGVIAVLETAAEHVADMDACLFAAFYHDIVYDVVRNDNEEQSAEMAISRLMTLSVPVAIVERCSQHILATKQHMGRADPDTNIFIDADLAILGGVPPLYQEYTRNIRREYSIYQDDIYTPGRVKVLEHFLAMSSIYKTTFFSGRYEQQARENIKQELAELSY